MPTEVLIPELGENVEEGDVVNLLVAAGDTIGKDQPVVELETGKATIEVPSTHAGTVQTVHLAVGDKARVGEVILTLDTAEATGEEETAAPEPPPQSEASAAPVETSPAPADAQELPIAASAVQAGTDLPARTAPPPRPERIPVAAAPSVRKLAREVGVDVGRVRGTGPGGRVTFGDVKAYAKQLIQTGPAGAGAGAGPAAAPLPDFTRWGAIERRPMSNIRKATAEHMARSWAAIPHVTQNDKADITRLEQLRRQWAAKAEARGTRLTPTAILLRIVASALRVYPKFNATIDVGNGDIIFKQYIHIGVAVDTPKGLVVPVVRNADAKNILTLAGELEDLAGRARAGKVSPDEMAGGTFTLTNLGGIGGGHFSPIINFPEVAILGVGRAEQEPVLVNGAFAPRLRMPLSLSYDHRLIDGAEAARFLRWVVEAMEEPLLLAMEG